MFLAFSIIKKIPIKEVHHKETKYINFQLPTIKSILSFQIMVIKMKWCCSIMVSGFP